MQANLTRHIKKLHREETVVASALRLPKDARNEEFRKLKRLGIKMHNKEESSKQSPHYHGERKSKIHKVLFRCSNCNAFVSKRSFRKHRAKCTKKFDAVPCGISIELENLPSDKFINPSKEFSKDILVDMQEGSVKKVILSDKYILYLGQKYYEDRNHKKSKIVNVRKSTRSEMRCLAKLYQAFMDEDVPNLRNGNILDMFDRDNFFTLSKAVKELNTKDDGERKPGATHSTFYTLLRCSKHLEMLLHISKEDVLKEEMAQFVKCLKDNESLFMSGARHELFMNSQRRNRKPCNLPLEEDISVIFNHINKRLAELTSQMIFMDTSVFVEIRNLVHVRLTLINASRGGGVSTTTLEEWFDGRKGGWIDTQRMENLSDGEKILVSSIKTIYLPGKGNRHLISVLVPKDCVEAMDILSNPEIR